MTASACGRGPVTAGVLPTALIISAAVVQALALGASVFAGTTAEAASALDATTAELASPSRGDRAEERPFDPEADSDALALVPEEERDALEESLLDAGRNWRQLADAVEQLEGERRAACVWLIDRMPHLDRLEMPSATLVEHVEYAFAALRDMPYGVPEDMFEPYILTYRIGEEPVDAWRRVLFERFRPLAEADGTVEGTAAAVNRSVAASVTERDRDFFGPTQSPLLTLKSGHGTEEEIAILTCATMKALGIPSRQVSVAALGSQEGGANWVEVFAGGEWLPLYPLEPEAFGDVYHIEREHWRNVTVAATQSAFENVLVTERYTETGSVELSFVADGEPAAGFEHFSVSVLNDGALVPLDALNAVADDEGRFSAVLGNGRYVVEAGVRDSDGYPFVIMRDLTLTPGSLKRLAFDVTPGGDENAVDTSRLSDFESAMSAWVAFDLEHEPSRRMLPLIAAALDRRPGVVDARYIYMGKDPNAVEQARETLGPDAVIRTISDPSEWYYWGDDGKRVAIGQGGASLPVVRLYARRGHRLILNSEGYDLNIERRLASAIDGHLEELITK